MPEHLIRLVHDLGRPKVLVVGDLMLDRYVHGSVGRISPEAPIPVLKVEKQSDRIGGAGSVASDLCVLGAEVSCTGVIGCDPDGDRFLAELKALGVSGKGIFRSEDRPTTLKTRFIARQQHVLRVDHEDTSELPEDLQATVADFAEDAIPNQKAVVIQDYNKGVATPQVCQRIIRACRQHNVPVLVDPGRGVDCSRYRGASCLKPNRAEAAAAAGHDLNDDLSIHLAGLKLIKDLDLAAVVITLDRDGLYMIDRGGDELHVAAETLDVYDVTGAGDMVISALAMVIACGGSYRDAAAIAAAAAAVEVTKLGAQPVTRHEIIAQLSRQGYSYARKVADEDALKRILQELHDRGKKIVFTNGCFDLLHVGHIRLLHDARKLGDVLVVGLNTDASIRRQKGPQRPILPEEERAHVLAAIADVDYIILFDEDTPLRLIEQIVKPDVLVKGSDYIGKIVVGREWVEANGGRVELVPIVEGASTTSIVSRILNGNAERGVGDAE